MKDPSPVFVWRTVTNPVLGTIGGKCIYCSYKLTDVDPITEGTQRDWDIAQRRQFGKVLTEFTEEEWEPHRQKRAEYNSTDYGGDHPMPETLEEAKEFFFTVDMHPL